MMGRTAVAGLLGMHPVRSLLRLAGGGEDRTMRQLPAPSSMAAPISPAMRCRRWCERLRRHRCAGALRAVVVVRATGPSPEWAETRRQAGLGRAGLFRPAR